MSPLFFFKLFFLEYLSFFVINRKKYLEKYRAFLNIWLFSWIKIQSKYFLSNLHHFMISQGFWSMNILFRNVFYYSCVFFFFFQWPNYMTLRHGKIHVISLKICCWMSITGFVRLCFTNFYGVQFYCFVLACRKRGSRGGYLGSFEAGQRKTVEGVVKTLFKRTLSMHLLL